MLGPDDRGRAERDCRPDHGAEVLRVLDLVEGDEQRIAREVAREIVDADDDQVGRISDRPLMTSAFRRAIELAARDLGDRRAAIRHEACDGLDLRAAALFDEDALEALSVNAD